MTDSGLSDNLPVTFAFRMEKATDEIGIDSKALWGEECEDLRRNPIIQAADEAYEEMKQSILEPDVYLTAQIPP